MRENQKGDPWLARGSRPGYPMTAALVVSVVAIEVNTVINTCKILDQIVLFFCSIAT